MVLGETVGLGLIFYGDGWDCVINQGLLFVVELINFDIHVCIYKVFPRSL